MTMIYPDLARAMNTAAAPYTPIEMIGGTSANKRVLDEINSKNGVPYYAGSENDPFRNSFAEFRKTFLSSYNQDQTAMTQIMKEIESNTPANDESSYMHGFDAVTSEEQLAIISPQMQFAILSQPKIRALVESGVFSGFNVNPKDLPEDDIFEEAISSTDIHKDIADKDLMLECGFNTALYDLFPDINEEELENISATREFIDEFINNPETQMYDPTDYPNYHL